MTRAARSDVAGAGQDRPGGILRAMARGLRVLAIAFLPLALVLSHRNLALILCLIGLSGVMALRDYRPPRWAVPFWLLAGYAAVSVIWSPAAEDADWALRIPAFGLLLAASLAGAGRRAGEVRVFGLAVLAGCLLLGAEALTGGLIRDLVPPFQRADKDDVATARGIGLALLLLPGGVLCLAAAAGRNKALIAGGAAALCLAAGTLRFGVSAHALALVAGAASAGLALAAPRAVPAALTVLFGAAFLVMPLLAQALPPVETLADLEAGPVSWRQRLVIWKTVAELSTESVQGLVFGAGQHAADAMGQEAGTILLPGYSEPLPRLPSHPHNVFLQVAYEFGLLGSVLCAGGAGLAAKRLIARPLPRGLAAAGAALGAAALVLMAIDAGLWSLWRASGLALGAYGLALGAGSAGKSRHCAARRAGLTVEKEKRSPAGG